MLKKLFTSSASAALLIISMARVGLATPQEFAGSWINQDTNTGGITRLVITQNGNGLIIQTFGRCHPTDCDWGQTALTSYGSNVQDTDHTRATALYRPDHANILLALQLQGSNRNQISLQNFTRFTDNSNRQNYFSQATFRRAGLTAPAQVSPANGQTFNHYPRTTTLRWSAVPGASRYGVEIDCYQCCQANQWCSEVGGPTHIVENLSQTSYTWDFVGAQPGRWRVWAIDANGNVSPKSPWRSFRYTR